MSSTQSKNTNSRNMKEKDIGHQEETLLPKLLPFEHHRLQTSRLLRNHNYEQIIDAHGSYVFVRPKDLLEGGCHLTTSVKTHKSELFLVGDLGKASPQRASVLKQLEHQLQDNQKTKTSNIIFGLGDWMYPYGPTDNSAKEISRTEATILDDLAPITSKHEFYGILGNHEYGDSTQISDPKVFLDLANKHFLKIPQRYYSLEISHKDWVMDCFALDTSTLACDHQQMSWFNEKVKQSCLKAKNDKRKHWRIIMGHHPLVSYGFHHEENEFLIQLLGKPLEYIDLYCAGHEHDMQLIRSDLFPKIPPIIVSGTASDSRMTWRGDDSILSSSVPGYSSLKVSKESIDIIFYQLNKSQPLLTFKI